MNRIVLFVALFACLVCASEKYTNKYDHLDFEKIRGNDRLLEAYFKCIAHKPGAPCAPEAEELKSIISDALVTNCAKCSDFQRQQAATFIKFIIQHKRPYWNELVEIYDKNHVYQQQHEDELKKEGILF